MTDLNIREATEGDIPEILDVLRSALGETPLLRRTTELWAWKHRDNPFGESIVLVSEADGSLAGVRAFMRWNLRTVNGDTLRCVRPVDTATRPEFARRGIFRDLTLSAVEVARARGIDLIFNTPNQSSAPGYLKMGWQLVSWIGVMVRPRFGRTEASPEDEPPSIGHMAPELNARHGVATAFADLGKVTGLTTDRSPAYLEWRFRSHPTASYGWLADDTGAAVCRASVRGGRNELVVSELLGSPDPSIIGKVARRSRVRYLAGWFSPGSEQRRVAIRGGLLPIPRLRSLRLVAFPLTEIDSDPFDLGSWQLSTADLELL